MRKCYEIAITSVESNLVHTNFFFFFYFEFFDTLKRLRPSSVLRVNRSRREIEREIPKCKGGSRRRAFTGFNYENRENFDEEAEPKDGD